MKDVRFYSLLMVLFLSTGWECAWATRADTVVIVAFGNSTTARRAGVAEGYPQRLHHLLDAAGIPNKVVNAGVGGSHTGFLADNAFHQVRHGRDRFGEVLAQRADWVLIWFGTNDAWVDDEQARQSRISLEKYKENLNYFIHEIGKQGGQAILMTPNPLGRRYEPWRAKRLARYRTATIRVAKANRVVLVDVWKLFNKEIRENGGSMDDLLLDGMHPNDRAHKLIAEVLDNVIQTDENDEKN